MDETFVRRELFGGAILVDVPARFADVSDFRPVPDYQEVFADGSKDQSVVVEILEHVATVSDSGAAEHYFRDLAEANSSEGGVLETSTALGPSDAPGVPGDAFRAVAIGRLSVVKHRKEAPANEIQLVLIVIRLPKVGSDLVISLNTPISIAEGSASAEHAGAGLKTDHEAAPSLAARMLRSLEIRDWGLFGHGEGPGAA